VVGSTQQPAFRTSGCLARSRLVRGHNCPRGILGGIYSCREILNTVVVTVELGTNQEKKIYGAATDLAWQVVAP
jgi:hypothetical protein